MKFHASYNRHDSEDSIVDRRLTPPEYTVRVPRFIQRERLLVVSWATPALHMNILRVRRGVAESLTKVVGTVLILAIMSIGISGTGGTISYFADTESSIGNLMVADPLGFTLSLVGSSQVDMSTKSAYVIPVLTPNADSEPIQYSVTGHMTSGDSVLCSNLHVLATSSVSYDGPLYTFTTEMSTSTGEVPLFFTLDDVVEVPPNSSCFVELAFKGRNADAPQGTGYSDEKLITVQFYVPAVPEEAPLIGLRTFGLVAEEEVAPEETPSPETASTSEEAVTTTPPLPEEATTTEQFVENIDQAPGQGSSPGGASAPEPPPEVIPPPEVPSEPEVIPPPESTLEVPPEPEVLPPADQPVATE